MKLFNVREWQRGRVERSRVSGIRKFALFPTYMNNHDLVWLEFYYMVASSVLEDTVSHEPITIFWDKATNLSDILCPHKRHGKLTGILEQ